MTFMIADVRGYSRFTLEHGDEVAARLAARFADLAREATQGHEGTLLELRGDEALCVFVSVRQALRAAAYLQRRSAEESAADPSLPLPVGIGLDAGEAVPVEGGLRGTALNLAARLCSLAAAGEIMITETVSNLARKMDGFSYVPRGPAVLKGFDTPVNVLQFRPSEESLERETRRPTAEAVESRQPVGGFLGARPPTALVSRRPELARLRHLLTSAASGEGRLVVLSGEAGIGKTRLSQELARLATEEGFLVTTGRCYEQRAGVPFYPFLEVLSGAYERAPGEVRADAVKRFPDLGRLLPREGGLRPPRDTGGQEQEALFDAVAGFILSLAASAPVALLLDDLQWADSPSLELVQHLARRTRGASVFILGTHRDMSDDWQHPLAIALRDLHREHLVETVKLGRLDLAGTGALLRIALGNEVDPVFVERIHEYAGGNPFFTRELLRGVQERGELCRTEDGWTVQTAEVAIPDTVRSAVGARLHTLDEAARRVVQQASVLGATFTFTDLLLMEVTASPRTEEELESALERAVGTGLVVEAGTEGFTFSHALVQHTIYSGLTAQRRRRWHRSAGEALARLPAFQGRRRAWEIARHFEQGGDKSQAVHYLLVAGEEAERVFAHAEAERAYRQCLELLPSDGVASSPLAAQIRWRLGRVLKLMARYDESLRMLEAAHAIFTSHAATAERIGVAAEIGTVHFVTGALAEGIGRIERFLASAGDSDPGSPSTAPLYIPLAHLHMAMGANEASLRAAERAASLAAASGDQHTRAQAQAIQGEALRMLGREPEALSVLQDSVASARAIGDGDGEFLALDAVAELLVDEGNFLESERYRQQAVELVERMGDPAKIAWERTSLGYLMYCMGRWSTARQQLEAALGAIDGLPSSRMTAYALVRLGNLDLGEGRWEEARRELEEGISLSRQVGSEATEIAGCGLLAELDLLEGEPARAVTHLRHALSHSLSDNVRAALLAVLALAQWRLGEERPAEETSEQSVVAARVGQNRVALLDALRVAGIIRAQRRAWTEAEDAFGEALSTALDMPYPHAVARILHAWAGMGILRGREDEGRMRLERARQIFSELGATREASICVEEAARLAPR